MSHRSPGCRFLSNIFCGFLDVLAFVCLSLRTSSVLAAENLFLRKQLGLYVERKKKPRRATDSVRFTLAQLSRFFEWRPILTVVKPDTLIRWQSERIPALLEMEVSVECSAESANRSPKVDRPHGFKQSDMGRGADRKRTSVEDWNSDFAADDPPLHAGHTAAAQGPVSAVDDLRTQSRQGHDCR